MKRIICKSLICFALLALSAGCMACTGDAPAEDTTDAPTVVEETPTETESPEDMLRREDTAFLATVTDYTYELTGQATPGFVGRWYEKEIQSEIHTVTVTDGSQFYFLVDGTTTVDVVFTKITTKEEPYFAYVIDGGAPVRQHITEPTITLPDSGRHLVQIVADAMTETELKWRREIGFAFKEIIPGEGGRIAGVLPTGKVIFYFGDSITEGIRALNMNATADGNSATNAYPWYCSQALGAVTWNVGYGATGLIQTGSFATMIKAMDYYSYNREATDTLTPDIIVINHGTNDGGHPDETFIPALEAALARLREKWPDTPVVYMIPFLQDSAKAPAIRSVMATFDNGYVVETADWPMTYTDGVHPDVNGAKVAGERLAAALVEIFGEAFFK